jgi:hypothetical protein
MNMFSLTSRVTLPRQPHYALNYALAFLATFVFSASAAFAQSCRWDGTAPLCSGSCQSDEAEISRLGGIPDFWVPPFVNQTVPFGSNCVTGTKALCCKGAGVPAGCRWDGTAPFCEGECRKGEVSSNPPAGSSSGSGCWTGSKKYCCPSVGTSRQPLVARDCTYGADTCASGFVWREANSGDHACVTPQVREQVRRDNGQAANRRRPGGGAYGPDTCKDGYVWREAFTGDHVCVSPREREQARQDNKWRSVRKACT